MAEHLSLQPFVAGPQNMQDYASIGDAAQPSWVGGSMVLGRLSRLLLERARHLFRGCDLLHTGRLHRGSTETTFNSFLV